MGGTRSEAIEETTVEVDRAAATPGIAAPAGAPPTSAAAVLGLQRTAGNRAVGRLLRVERSVITPAGFAPVTAARPLQRRRLPGAADITDLLSDPSGATRVASADSAAFNAGLTRLWTHIRGDLSPAEKADVQNLAQFGLTTAQVTALTAAQKTAKQTAWNTLSATLKPWEVQARYANALATVRPGLKLGDPKLINTGPRPATADAAHITTLVTNANKVFDKIAAGAADADIDRVFGAANRATAKAKYKKARDAMNTLATTGHVVTDRSGYNREVSLGGLTGAEQISLAPGVIDNPDKRESVVTMMHESMHAGNPGDVGDNGVYIDRTAEFPKSPVSEKLTNAAHFEVVPRRLLPKDAATDPDDPSAYGGCVGCAAANPAQTFTPAGTAGPHGATPADTPREKALKAAYRMFKEAWTLGLNLHDVWVSVLKAPADWNTLDLGTRFGGALHGRHFKDVLPFWSKVEKLTVHERTHITPTAATASTKPVTLIDIALSEAVVRQLALGMDATPANAAAADALETAAIASGDIGPVELHAALASVNKERDLLIKLVLKQIGSVTDTVDRDLAVVLRMGKTGDSWNEILARRPPSAFPLT